MAGTIKVVNCVNYDKDEPNRGWVAKDQEIEVGVREDEYGQFVISEVEPMGENPLSDWDTTVYTPLS